MNEAQVLTRQIRVFVSSTFRDMQAERDELVKRIFPQLRKLCEERSVTWGDVDLRWGVTDEQKAEGNVLPVCLEEIHRCRPYFIGLLGERYGWVPEKVPQELIELQPWLAGHRERSITELEIVHGVLRNAAMAEHAFFYFRDPSYIDSLPEDRRGEFREDSPEGRTKLAALKDRIRASGSLVRENYRDPVELGQRVLRDLTAVIDFLFPAEEKPDPLDQEAAGHEAFAESRAKVYIGRQDDFDRLGKHAAGDSPPLVLVGESGVGKSALLANWALEYRKVHPDELVLMHFIGASPQSADWAAMLRRIMGELRRRFGVEQEIPDKPDALRLAFTNALHMAAARGRVVLVLDALNQLEDRDGAPDLVWLPPVIPGQVRMFLSTLPGRPLDDLNKRGWAQLEVQPLKLEERRRLITAYIAPRTLNPERLERIACADQSANPLYLRSLLEELRVFGSYEWLGERIEHYLAAETIPELYEKILARWEADYERERPGLVRDATTLIWAARQGLSEAELLDLLGANGEPLPRAYWSPLYLAAEQALVSRSGLIGFFHDHLRQAVQNRYLMAEQGQRAVHLRLAGYFGEDVTLSRALRELAWQLHWAQDHRRLRELLEDLAFFALAWQEMRLDAHRWWSMMEAVAPESLDTAFAGLARGSFEYLDYSRRAIVVFPPEAGDAQAKTPSACIKARFEITKNAVDLLMEAGHFARAEELLNACASDFTEPSHRDGLDSQRTLVLINKGDIAAAKKIIETRQGRDEFGGINVRNHLAVAYLTDGQLDAGMELLQQNESLIHKYLDAPIESIHRWCCENHVNQSHVMLHRRDVAGAARKLAEAERICVRHGLRDLLVNVIANQGVCARLSGQFQEATQLHLKQAALARELGLVLAVAQALCQQGMVFEEQGDVASALQRFEAALPVAKSVQNAYWIELIQKRIAKYRQ